MWKRFLGGIVYLMLLLMPFSSWAAHPLISDDTGTQSKGNFQLELNGQYDWDKKDDEDVSVKTKRGQAATTLSYGIAKNVDLVFSLPYLWGKVEENETTMYDEKGISDAVLETKWRLFEHNGLSLALKPGISIPTGNDEKGLGTGVMGGHLFLIGSKELGAWAFHTNLGYIRRENKADERRDIWHASMAATWGIIKDLKLVANVGMERNPDDEAKDDPAFLIGGVIYSVNENFDVDFGVKYGLNDAETDISALAGIAFRF